MSENKLRWTTENIPRQSQEIPRDFGLRLLDLMVRRGMSVDDVAAAADLSPVYIDKLCRNEIPAPGIVTVRLLSSVLGYPVSCFSPATDVDTAMARDEEVYLDWMRMRQMELQEDEYLALMCKL